VRSRLRRLGSALIPWGVAIFLLLVVGDTANNPAIGITISGTTT
jgi:hypothetical protein